MSREKLWYVKYKMISLWTAVDEKIYHQFGFHAYDVSLDNIINYLYTPKDSSSLAVTRILFGIAMLFDIAGERGGATMIERWGNPSTCHFPLLPFVRAVAMPSMALVYAILWLGAAGITLGYKYRTSATAFTLSYWYLFLVEKSFWNNHSYLFGLVATLLAFTDAHCCWSIDAVMYPSVRKRAVPYWNYFILKYQFFILYFMAGLKKGTAEWLTGYSVQNLSEHWVFNPFKVFLTVPQTDYLVVHWFVFAFDLTVAVWMMWGRTRHIAMVFCALFHLMNSRLFSIGMFPWVCLATMPLFYPFDWPKRIGNDLKILYVNVRKEICEYINFIRNLKRCLQSTDKSEAITKQLLNNDDTQIIEDAARNKNDNVVKDGKDIVKDDMKDVKNIDEDENNGARTRRDNIKKAVAAMKTFKRDKKLREHHNAQDKQMKTLTVALIFVFIATQGFLPFSHFITQGYNNWTNGLYGYSWDMMVHTWDTNSVVVKIVDNNKNVDYYIDPYLYAPNDRWTRHGDMLHQYAHCLKDNLVSQVMKYKRHSNQLSYNLSIYVDVWCSMNGRFTQRMFDSKQDLLNVSWSPFQPVTYLMPLLDDAVSWRSVLQDVRREVHSWHNASDVIFIADFPGYDQQKYIPNDLSNVTLTVLKGNVSYEPDATQILDGQSYKLTAGRAMKVKNGMFHKVHNIGDTPAYYMYTFVNASDGRNVTDTTTSKLPIVRELTRQLYNMIMFFQIVTSNLLKIFEQFSHCPNI